MLLTGKASLLTRSASPQAQAHLGAKRTRLQPFYKENERGEKKVVQPMKLNVKMVSLTKRGKRSFKQLKDQDNASLKGQMKARKRT